MHCILAVFYGKRCLSIFHRDFTVFEFLSVAVHVFNIEYEIGFRKALEFFICSISNEIGIELILFSQI